MGNLLKQMEARMSDPKLNANFNREVSKSYEISKEDRKKYALVHMSFQAYKKNVSNWKRHFD